MKPMSTLVITCGLLCAQQVTLTDSRLMELAQTGVSETEMLRLVNTAPTIDFDLRPAATEAMVKAGITENVIKAMSARENGSTPGGTPNPSNPSGSVTRMSNEAVNARSADALGQVYLSPQEIASAIAGPPNSGFVLIEDGGFTTPSLCETQMPSIALFTPSGWLNALSENSKKQLLDYVPKQEDTRRVLTIVAKGCVGATMNDTLQSITRVVLLSLDREKKIEPVESHPSSSSWQNSYGATAITSNLVSKFSMDDLKKVQNTNGEFAVATMNPNGITKIYTIKPKHLKKLGL